MGPRFRCGPLRSRGQFLVRLRLRIEGLLYGQAHRNETVAARGLRQQQVLLARSRDQRAERCRRLERRPFIRQDVRQLPRLERIRDQKPAHAGSLRSGRRPEWGSRLPDRPPDRHLGSRAWSVELPGPGGPVRRRTPGTLHLDRSFALALAREDGLHLMDAAGRRQPDEPAVPFQQQGRVEGCSDAQSRQRLVRSRPGAQRAADSFEPDLGRLDVSRRRHRGLVHVHRLPERRNLFPRLQHQLPRLGRLRAADSRRDYRLQPALHVEPDRRKAVVLGDRRQGSSLLDNRRLRAHPHPGLRGPDSESAAHLPRRDDLVLLGRTSRDRDDWRRSARKRTARRAS